MRHNNIESIRALTHNQQPSMEASMADANNNNSHGHAIGYSPLAADAAGTLASEIRKDEKYSLRQRQSRRTTLDSRNTNRTSAASATAAAAAAASTASSTTTGTSSTGASTTKEKPPPKEKPKPKAAPLSKYRRKTANARERSRMREINSAFENLRRAVPLAVAGTSGTSSPVSSPQQCSSSGGASSSEKLTKITTLRMAMKYIRILSDMLSSERPASGGYDNNNDLDMINHNEIEREVMQKGLLLRDGLLHGYGSPDLSPVRLQYDPAGSSSSSSNSGSTTTTTGTTTSGHSSAASGNNSRKRSASKKSATGGSKAKKSAPASSTRSSSRKLPGRASNSQAVKPTLTSGETPTSLITIDPDPTIDPGPGLDTTGDPLSNLDVDLGSVLESDNDSLILSERCLSPGVTAGLKGPHGFPGCPNAPSDSTVVPNDNLEFGLFLESDADSLQLSEPCLSPLSHLDALNPFNELLHTGFNEQTALELYL
ncbi:helix-loop-helix protein delilah [Anopheles darlingi]|uniref:helix-loop-helix protein delilah n=1 Tax=Anopheles darlingi TaxID=43151 RepID=UPI002100573E|nr:helix-loop-helix protein delilah [Anopheles darlingi]